MNWGHDSGLSGGGLCGCAGCTSGHAAALDGRQALTASQTSGDSIVDALVAGGWSQWGPVGLMGQAVTVTYSCMTAPPSNRASGVEGKRLVCSGHTGGGRAI